MSEIIQGDIRHVARTLASESVHCIITSPPYWGLRDYGTAEWEGGEAGCDHKRIDIAGVDSSTLGGGKGNVNHAYEASYKNTCPRCGARRIDAQLGLEATPEQYLAEMVAIFRELRRVLRSDGSLWLNMGDSYFGSWGNYGDRGGGQREKQTERFDRRAYEDKTEWRPPTSLPHGNLKPKDLCGIPWRLALALQADGWWLRSDIIWAKPNPMPESVTDRPTKAHEYVFLLTKSARYFYDAEAVREAASEATLERNKYGWNGAFKGQFQGTPNEKRWQEGRPIEKGNFGEAGRNRRTVWTIATQPYAEAHFATFPPALVEPCILAGTSARGVCPACGAPWARVVENIKGENDSYNGSSFNKGKTKAAREHLAPVGEIERTATIITTGWQPTCACPPADPIPATVLDPFFGSGTTGLVAVETGRAYLGVELNPDYIELARRRLAGAQPALIPKGLE